MQPGQSIPAPHAGEAESRLWPGRLRAVTAEVFGIDLRTLALFRIGLGLLLLVDLVLRGRDLTAHYTDVGILPRSALLETLSVGSFSLHLLNGTFAFQAVLFAIATVFAVMILVGSRTRFAVIASWVLLLSLQNRNPEILSAGDTVLLLLCFWAIQFEHMSRFVGDG